MFDWLYSDMQKPCLLLFFFHIDLTRVGWPKWIPHPLWYCLWKPGDREILLSPTPLKIRLYKILKKDPSSDTDKLQCTFCQNLREVNEQVGGIVITFGWNFMQYAVSTDMSLKISHFVELFFLKSQRVAPLTCFEDGCNSTTEMISRSAGICTKYTKISVFHFLNISVIVNTRILWHT